MKTTLLGLLAAALAGCSLTTPRVQVPMSVIQAPDHPCPGHAPVLLVMLPGIRSTPQEFIDEGFVTAVRRRGIAADIAIADAHIGYFEDRSVLRRLQDDVLAPARAHGVRSIWLVGISLGGFAALGQGERAGRQIDGIVALAPYLGRRTLLQEIGNSGGPAAWALAPTVQAANEPDRDRDGDRDELDRDIWQWLSQGANNGAKSDSDAPLPVYLGYGNSDRFADAQRVLQALLPAARSDTVAGGHDWPTWLALWERWLDRGLLPTTCNAAAP